MDDIEEWSGCSYNQLKEMSQDWEQWRRRKTLKCESKKSPLQFSDIFSQTDGDF